MINAFVSVVTFDNGLLIAIIGLIAGLAPGILAAALEHSRARRQKVEADLRAKHLEGDARQSKAEAERFAEDVRQTKAEAKRFAESVSRLEDLVTLLENTNIALTDQETVSGPHTQSTSYNSSGRSVIPPEPYEVETVGASPVNRAQTSLNLEPSGKYIVWMRINANTPPRYVLLTWDTADGRVGYRVRDYLGGLLLHQSGSPNLHEPRFQSSESSLSIGELWSQARCHLKARGELDHAVNDFQWWHNRLHQLTKGHDDGHAISLARNLGKDNRNVLLMLSSAQKPPPRDEVHWHAINCAKNLTTYLATTRILTGLTKNKSVVAFYGDVKLFNQVLGYGIFIDFIRADTPEGQKILDSHVHYNELGKPDKVLGLIQMRDFQELPEGVCLESFDGTIVAEGVGNGRQLTLLNLPEGPARAQIYYRGTSEPETA